MIDKPLKIGAFEVGTCIGQGGMGKVYRAVHSITGVPVALKVVADLADGESKRAFHREVQAQAGLVHPGVVYLFDYGAVDSQAAQAFNGELEEGSPYVVMELADRQTVRSHMPFDNWQAVCDVLLEVLDALAFAHARGVVHRDLKPENFLVFGTDNDRGRVKLADFGLAHALGHSIEESERILAQISGTPYYMAPEQFHGSWRAYGPWTDLYALGCIAWHFICGRPPYQGTGFFSFALKHCEGEIPAMEPLFDIPDGVRQWVDKAMAIDPGERFQRAADAAWALPKGDGMAGAGGVEKRGRAISRRGVDTTSLQTLQPFATIKQWDFDDASERKLPAGHREDSAPSLDMSGPPVPTGWQTARRDRLPTQLAGTGLGLFGLREVPFVGRDGARDQIWRALQEVAEEGELRVVFVQGESGVGKSRLVHWMVTRAHEVGAAKILKALHSAGGRGPTEGLAGLVQRAFHAWRLSREQLYEELLQRLEPLDEEDAFRDVDARALTELVHPTEDDTDAVVGPRYQFASSLQKYALIHRLLLRFARHRAPVMWLDDLHYSSEGLGLVEYLLDLPDAHRPAALILCTLRSDVLADNRELAQRVADVADNECCRRIELDAIDPSDHRELIDRILPLAPDVVDTLARRTEGNPLFAHQLLSHWIATDDVAISDEGFGVVPGKPLSLPDDIHELWMERVERLLRQLSMVHSTHAEAVIELAAALGREVDPGEWRDLCTEAGYAVATGLDDILIERGLAVRTADGWAFAHGLLVDSLARRAIEGGRWKDHHRHCAKMLEDRYPESPQQTARRRADHWIEAGELERALDPLLEESSRWFELEDLSQWKQSLKLHRHLLDRLQLDPLAPQRLENDLLTNKALFLFENKTDQGIEGTQEVLRRGREIGDAILALRAHEQLATFLITTGDIESAQRELQTALDLAANLDDQSWQGKVLQRLSETWLHTGELDEADRCARRARDHFRDSGLVFDELLCDARRGWVQLGRARFEEARQILEGVLKEVTRRGFRSLESYCLNGLGDVARFSGRVVDARQYYEQSRLIELEMGDLLGEATVLLNLAQIELALGHFERGRQLLEQAQVRTNELEGGRYREFFDCMEILLACGDEDWARVRHILNDYQRGWPTKRPVYKDHAWLLERAVTRAEQAGRLEHAQALRGLAIEVWTKLGNDEAAAQV